MLVTCDIIPYSWYRGIELFAASIKLVFLMDGALNLSKMMENGNCQILMVHFLLLIQWESMLSRFWATSGRFACFLLSVWWRMKFLWHWLKYSV